MKVLYLYPKTDQLISRHVSLLTEGLRYSADIRTADSVGTLRKAIQEKLPDIIHCHGLPSVTAARTIFSTLNKGVRLVLTLHGQLEPWADDRQRNIAAVYWQKELVQKSYAVILLGRLERTNFMKTGWNPRIEEIHNAVITNTISPQKMSTDTFSVYQKVLDSDTLALMDEPTEHMLRAIIKVGIMGDRHWAPVLPSGSIGWRQLMLYAEHENIRNYVDYGISLLGCNVPAIDTSSVAVYFPDSYTTPRPVRETVGDYLGKETEYLVRIISQIRQQPLLLHLVELTRELYRDTVDDERLSEALKEKGLTAFAQSLMQVLSEQTGLDEGYMPLPPADNKLTRQIRQQITNHLKI
jgi:hypothetical protein